MDRWMDGCIHHEWINGRISVDGWMDIFVHTTTKLNIQTLGTVEFPLILYCKLVDIDGAPIINELEFDASGVVDNASQYCSRK